MLPVASSGVYGAYIRNKSSETGSMHVQACDYTICTWAYAWNGKRPLTVPHVIGDVHHVSTILTCTVKLFSQTVHTKLIPRDTLIQI